LRTSRRALVAEFEALLDFGGLDAVAGVEVMLAVGEELLRARGVVVVAKEEEPDGSRDERSPRTLRRLEGFRSCGVRGPALTTGEVVKADVEPVAIIPPVAL
jgi:hypothetical protein